MTPTQLSPLELQLKKISNDYDLLFKPVASSRLSSVSQTDRIYDLTICINETLAAVQEEQRKELEETKRKSEVLTLLAHLKTGDYSLFLARTSYLQHKTNIGSLSEVDLDSIRMHLRNAESHYDSAKVLFLRLAQEFPQTAVEKDEKVSAVKFRGKVLQKGNYVSQNDIKARKEYRSGVYDAIMSRESSLEAKFESWEETIGKELFRKIRPYLGKERK